MKTKICTTCKIEFLIDEFPIINNHGKMVPAAKCKECFAEYKALKNKQSYEKYKENRQNKQKEYHGLNKDKINSNRRLNRNPEKEKIKQKEKYLKNKVVYIQKAKEYYEKNKEHLRIKNNENSVRRSKTDMLYKLKKNIRSLIRQKFINNGYTKKSKTNDILGCSYESFKTYIESKWEPWMNWDNYGLYNGTEKFGWDIDHKTPLSIAETVEDVARLNHYTNLQPLCSYMNRVIKRDNL